MGRGVGAPPGLVPRLYESWGAALLLHASVSLMARGDNALSFLIACTGGKVGLCCAGTKSSQEYSQGIPGPVAVRQSMVHLGLARMAAVSSGEVLHVPGADTKQVESRMSKITQKSEGFMGEMAIASLLPPR